MLKIFQFSQIHKYNYKKNSLRLYMPNKKTRILFFEKNLTETQGNMQKQCLRGCFTCFQSMFDK